MTDDASGWATVRVVLDAPPRERGALAEAADRLEELGALLAADPSVGGVESRDPSTFGAPTWPELVVYTTPSATPEIERAVGELAPALELDVRIAVAVHRDESWRDAWKQFHRPITIAGGRLLLRQTWHERRPGDPPVEIVLDPGRAFGTGQHASTRLCLETVCDLAAAPAPTAALDLGCGSGVLAIAMARLWTGCAVLAVDVDPQAAQTTRENVVDNGLEGRVDVANGTLESVEPDRRFDLVVANIRPAVLIPLAAAVNARARAGATVLLSGILEQEADDVSTAYAGVEMRERSRRSLDGWCALLLESSRP